MADKKWTDRAVDVATGFISDPTGLQRLNPDRKPGTGRIAKARERLGEKIAERYGTNRKKDRQRGSSGSR